MRPATDWMASRARLTPDRPAVVEVQTGLRLTYRELHQRIDRLAGHLLERGVGKGDRVALLAPNGVCYLELLYAAGKIGAIFVPLNTRFTVPELAYVLNDCQPTWIMYHELYAEVVRELQPLTTVMSWMIASDYQMVVRDSRPLSQRGADQPLIDMEDPWAIIYTGGTTGQSKGVILSHRAILWNSINTIVSWGLTEHDVTPVYLPMFHTGGLNALTTPILHAGGKVVIGTEFNPAAVLNVLEQEGCTIALFVPTMHHMFTTMPEFQTAKWTTMHTFLSGGAPCPHSIYEAYRAKGLQFKEGYGLTEAGPNNFYIDPHLAMQKYGSVGVPMFHNSVRVLDERGQEVSDGETGELWIQGPHVFSGYWNKPEVTAATLADGWLRTGDLARRDADGCHYIVGRVKDMIISGGENVYPLEVEQVLDGHPGISEAAVFGLPDPKWGEAVTAVIVPLSGQRPTEEQLKSYCAAKLSKYKIPKRFHFVNELPKTSVGKIDKKCLVQTYTATE